MKYGWWAGCFLAISCGAGGDAWIENRNTGGALGTSYSIIYLTHEIRDYQSQIDSVFAAVNHSLSTYVPDSDISRINAGDTSVKVDVMFREVFDLSGRVFRASDGYFDPTVGTLVNAWGFGPGKAIPMDSTKVDSLLEYVGFDKVALASDGTIKKRYPETYFDFNAVAKGYAIDRLARMLDVKGVDNYLIEVGGEIVAKGQHRIKQKEWVIGIDDPQVIQGRQLKILLHVKDIALASSGNYRKFRIDSVTGKKYVHTIDPKTGFTKGSRILATTVLADTCAEADAFATALMAMDLERGKALLEGQNHLEGYIIYLDAEGKTREFMTDGFRSHVLSEPKE